MNLIKQVFDDYIVVPSGTTDPFELSQPNGPWIIGSFPLWHYLKHIGIEPDWIYNDIDYVVNTTDQSNKLLNFFRDLNLTESSPFNYIHKFDNGKFQVNTQAYKDIRFRLYNADIDITQVGMDNNNFYLSKSAYKNIPLKKFKLTGKTFDQQRTNQRIQKYTKRGFVLQP